MILDTNVFIAAYWAPRSASARLIRACIDGLARAEYTEEIRREVEYVLQKVGVGEDYTRWVELFWQSSCLVNGVNIENIRTEDPDDQKFLEAAAGGSADFIVTNDEHLLRVGYIGRTEILHPSSASKLICSNQ